MKFKLLIALFICSISTFGQIHKHGDDHHDMKYEIGAAANYVYAINDKEFAPGFHIHGLRIISENFGAGVGYEGVFFNNYHQALTVFGEYIYKDFISIDVGPGFIFPNAESDHVRIVAHVEASAAFDIWEIHIGPMLGFAIGQDNHVSAGIHVGYHFK